MDAGSVVVAAALYRFVAVLVEGFYFVEVERAPQGLVQELDRSNDVGVR